MEIRRTLGDKVRIYRRADGGAWHCSTYMKGKEWRKSTKERSLARAKDVAEDWYLELCAKDRFSEQAKTDLTRLLPRSLLCWCCACGC